jgi:membrane protease YdiL (CAAX protease family)
MVACWRCGKEVEKGPGSCPYCLAALERGEPTTGRAARRRGKDDGEAGPILRLLAAFGGLLVTSLIYGAMIHFGVDEGPNAGPRRVEDRLGAMIGMELIDTILVVVALFWVSRPPPLEAPTTRRRLWTWALAGPALLVTLAANHGYHELLRGFIAAPPTRDELMAKGLRSAWIILAVCAQPAIVEELFFRYLALGTLRRSVGVHGAVWISSVMFGLAHIGVPLSIPMLTLVGVSSATPGSAAGA